MTRLIDADALMKEIAPMDKGCYCGRIIYPFAGPSVKAGKC